MAYTLMLKSYREKAGLTQVQMAEEVGVSFATYRNWEQGISRFTLEHAFKCSLILGCTPNDLCNWYEDHPEDRPCSDSVVAFRSQETELQALYDRCSPEVQSAAMAVVRSGAGSDADAHTAESSPHSISI